MKKLTRRDLCFVVSQRMSKLPAVEWAKAWEHLSLEVELLSYSDVPKFKDLMKAIRSATMKGKHESVKKTAHQT